ncbi:MAG TPA: hypothetical protein ENG51_07580 [Deltaproteobacteria bacterium]|nr:hypothetical protein [Deltaproteobacteria bacterium]
MKTLTCLKCGGKYVPKQGTLKDLEFCKFRITVEDVEYGECNKCERSLFPLETVMKLEMELQRVKEKEGGNGV